MTAVTGVVMHLDTHDSLARGIDTESGELFGGHARIGAGIERLDEHGQVDTREHWECLGVEVRGCNIEGAASPHVDHDQDLIASVERTCYIAAGLPAQLINGVAVLKSKSVDFLLLADDELCAPEKLGAEAPVRNEKDVDHRGLLMTRPMPSSFFKHVFFQH